MSDETGVREGSPPFGWRAANQQRVESARAASHGREKTGAWRQANLDMKAQASQHQGWEADPRYDLGTGRPTVQSTNVSRANRFVTAADLEADPYAAMDRAAKLSEGNPLDRLPKFDEDGLPSKKREVSRVPMPETPILLDDDPATALEQLGGMFRRALGALDSWRARRAERRGAAAPTTGTALPNTGQAEPIRSFLSDVAGGNLPQSEASGLEPELAGVFAQLQERAAGWNNPAREPIPGNLPDNAQPEAAPIPAPIAAEAPAEVSQAA